MYKCFEIHTKFYFVKKYGNYALSQLMKQKKLYNLLINNCIMRKLLVKMVVLTFVVIKYKESVNKN